ncbi:MAG: sulfite exporter TauE/SafE family protein, partial [Campylobacterales bacterium]|nr:sulfite exporter TauE/SafE family protein [Campylobacterales bacterium]
YKAGFFDKTIVYPLIVSSSIFSIIGAISSFLIDEEMLKSFFGAILILLSIFILIKKSSLDSVTNKKLLLSGAIGGFFSGLFGIGGGSIVVPILLLLGATVTKVVKNISFVIPVSSSIGFIYYTSQIEIDWLFFTLIALFSTVGAIVGNRLLVAGLNQNIIKIVISTIVLILGLKLI